MKLTRQTLSQLIDAIDTEFSSPNNRLSAEDKQVKLNLWYAILKDYSKEEVEKAVFEAINTCEFAPRVKTISDICKRERQPFGVSPNDLWNEVLNTIPYINDASGDMSLGNNRAWDDSINDYGEETYAERGIRKLNAVFEKLRPEIKRYFGNHPSRLARIAEMSAEERDFEKARFVKAIQPFMEQQAIADKNGMGDFYGVINGFTAKTIADKAIEEITEKAQTEQKSEDN